MYTLNTNFGFSRVHKCPLGYYCWLWKCISPNASMFTEYQSTAYEGTMYPTWEMFKQLHHLLPSCNLVSRGKWWSKFLACNRKLHINSILAFEIGFFKAEIFAANSRKNALWSFHLCIFQRFIYRLSWKCHICFIFKQDRISHQQKTLHSIL